MTRTELYDAVWLEPVSKVAVKLGLSDSGLATVCKRFDIPRPPRGYWRRIKTGQRLERPALPDPDNNPEVPLTIEGAKALGMIPSHSSHKGTFPALGEPPAPVITKPQPECCPLEAVERLAVGMGRMPAECTPEQAVRKYAAVEAELERAVNAGIQLQRNQAAVTIVQEILARAAREDPNTAQALLAWARSLQKRLEHGDPVDAVVQSIRQAVGSGETPLWWPF